MVSRLVGWLVGWCVGLFLSFRNIEVWRKFSYSLYFPHYLLEYYRAWPKMCYNNGNIYIQQDFRIWCWCHGSVVYFCSSRTCLQLYSQLNVQAMFDIYIRIKSFYLQVLCFDLRVVPSDITEDAKTVKSQEEDPCICHTTTNISVSITVTISLTVVFYLIFKCKTRFFNK